MPLTLITGPINSGKTARCLDLLAQCDPGRTGTVVVPDRAAASALRRRFAERFKGQFHAIRGDSVQDWATFIRTLAAPTLPVAKRGHSILLVLGILAKISLPYFGRTSRSYAMAAGFARTIIALKENLITPAELMSIISGIGEACLRERDLIKVYEAYEKELSRIGLLDEGDLTILAIKNALEGAPALAEMKTVMFDEFVSPTPAQIAMIRALASRLKHAESFVTSPVAQSEDEKPFASWLSRARDAWLSAIDNEDELPAPSPAKKSDVSVLRAATPAQEARHVALMVLNEKLPANDIVVASRSEDTFIEWFLSEAHSMGLLPEHPTLDGAAHSPVAHELISPLTLERLPREALVTEFIGNMIELGRMEKRARSWIAGLKKRRGHGRVAARSLTAAGIIEDSLRALATSADFLGTTKITREEFAQLFSHDLKQHTAPATMLESVLPFRNLTLGEPLATEASRVIVPRMIDGRFPRQGNETLFFNDWKEESVRRIFPDAEDLHAKESYAFETMIRKCRGKITLIMPAKTDSGAETIPSPFVHRFLAEDEAPAALEACVLAPVQAGRTKDEFRRLLEVESARIAGTDPLDSPLGAYLGVLSDPHARKVVRQRFVDTELNPTALERYANCPFSFFAQDVLRTAVSLEDTPQIRGFDRGKLVHEILTRFYRDHTKEAMAARSGREKEKNIGRAVRRIAEEAWEEHKDALAYVRPGLREREIEEIAAMALAVIAAEQDEARQISSPLIPSEFEWEFSNAKGSALKINVDGDEPLMIRGRVDRIDADPDESRFLVIDYKTGKEDQVVNRIESGEHLQLPLYIDAARSALLPGAMPVGGLMLEIREIAAAGSEKKTAGKTKGLVLGEFDGRCFRVGRSHAKIDQARMEELLNAARKKSAEIATLIRKGEFPASNEAKCIYCDYGDICRHKKVSAD